MEKDEVKGLIDKALNTLFSNQPDIFELTPETGQTEWSLACHLAHELHALLPDDFSYDLDVTKESFENKRPDIVFHKRGTHEGNFLVVEVKRNGANSELRDAMRRIKNFWFQPPLEYDFGAVVDIRSDKTYRVKVLGRANLVGEGSS